MNDGTILTDPTQLFDETPEGPAPSTTDAGPVEATAPAPATLAGLVISGRERRPRRAMLYGVQGVGKTTWAADAPAPIFVPTEDGQADIDCNRFPLCTTFDEFIGALRLLRDAQHEFRTVVVDSLDWLEQLIWKKVCQDKGLTSIEDFGYGKGYVAAVDQWRFVLDCLGTLRDQKRMGVVLLAHSKKERYENPETDSYDRYTPALHAKAAAVVQEWCDEVFFATYKVYTRSEDAGFNKTVAKGVGGHERIIRTTEKPFAVAKNRLRMPDEIALSWAAYQEYMKG